MANETPYKKNWLPKIYRVASIDLGSNAVRMMIAEVYNKDFFMPLKTSRKPLRLGHEVFRTGKISEQTMTDALKYFKGFKKLLKKYNVDYHFAVGTSALRDSKNSKKFIKLIKEQTGIEINLISGELEAQTIYTGISKTIDLRSRNTLLVDIGGGSLELTTINQAGEKNSASFQIGTVRSLELMKTNNVKDIHIDKLMDKFRPEIKKFLGPLIKDHKIKFCVGTGGNFERFAKLQSYFDGTKNRDLISYDKFIHIKSIVEKMSIQERMKAFMLKPDRADVIIPAGALIKLVMEEANVGQIMVPEIGLKDGIIYNIASDLIS